MFKLNFCRQRQILPACGLLALLFSLVTAADAYADVPAIKIGKAKLAGTFNYGYSEGFTLAVKDLYPVDLDNDGREEVIFAGFETQPNSPETYHNTKIAIFGWQGSEFVDLTSKWFPGVNRIEGTNDVVVGDFNGDGLTDIFMSAYTDMVHPVYAYEFVNKNGYFTKRPLDSVTWQHGATKANLNSDNYDDVVVSGYGEREYYLGGPNGLTRYNPLTYMVDHVVDDYNISGSDIVAAPFLQGSIDDLVVVDQPFYDTGLVRAIQDGSGQFGFENVSVLPPPPMSVGSNAPGSHDFRVRAMDFNSDGLKDVIVFSRADNVGSGWPELSTLQFLKNNGNGAFDDVTDTTLVGFTKASTLAYHPIIDDFNLDGRQDIFLSYSDYNDTVNSHALLMQNSSGQFVETERARLSKFVKSVGAMATIIHDGNNFFIVKDVQEYGGAATISIAPITFPQRRNSEQLLGTQLPDKIWGLGGDDQIFGLDGADFLVGGAGVDLLDLGVDSAADRVAYYSTKETRVRRPDILSNFDTSLDQLDLSAIDSNRQLEGNQAFVFSGTTPTPYSVWYLQSGSDVLVRGDTNGNTTPDFEIRIRGIGPLASSNFVL